MTRALVFDSGVGGLTIASELRRAAADWVVDYAADSGFFPYGVKTDEELRERLPRLCARLVEVAKPDVLVIACNTASTLSLADIRAQVSVPVVGTVPAIKPAAEQTRTGVIGILATPGTVRRAYLDELEHQFARGVTVIRRGTAGLVDIAERAVRGQGIDQEQVTYAVKPMFDPPNGPSIDIVVLACTHFPLIRDAIAAACPAGVRLIDTGEAVARQAMRVAPQTPRPPGAPIAYVTGGAANRAAMAPAFTRFGYDVIEVIDV
ncbi:MAG TPA: glutamate racemase [Hyphomonadaceae bacterium]|nr:glutamate racemase [Hyphomonadaceae bacterium]HPN04785.1 glutamate racemase [Hyphomonadaceae bacterium]